jgi:hypothetical protein
MRKTWCSAVVWHMAFLLLPMIKEFNNWVKPVKYCILIDKSCLQMKHADISLPLGLVNPHYQKMIHEKIGLPDYKTETR